MAFVAFLGDDMIAVGRYEQLACGDEAEVAFAVADAHQGRGLATLLLWHLARYARGPGHQALQRGYAHRQPADAQGLQGRGDGT